MELTVYLFFRYDDFDYGEVNHLMEPRLKTYTKTGSSKPCEVDKHLYDGYWTEFNHSEKVVDYLSGWPKNLEFGKLGKIKNLEFYRKIMEKPGTFFKFEFFNNFFIINKCI